MSENPCLTKKEVIEKITTLLPTLNKKYEDLMKHPMYTENPVFGRVQNVIILFESVLNDERENAHYAGSTKVFHEISFERVRYTCIRNYKFVLVEIKF